MVNKVILVGRLGRDPETRYTAKGDAVTHFSLVTEEPHKGEKRTDWHKVAVFGKLAEFAQQYLKKGSLTFIEGRLTTRSWEDKQGLKHSSTEILACEFRLLSPRQSESQQNSAAQTGPEITDEDIPF